VRLVQPLQVSFEEKRINEVLLVSLVIENGHKEVVTLYEAGVEVLETREEGGGVNYRDFFGIEYETDDFPITLRENERYNFVVSLSHLHGPLPSQNHKHPTTTPEVHITWSTPSLSGTMITPFKLPAPLSPPETLLVTFDTYISPIKLHSIFPINITVTNLGNDLKDIVIEIPLPELDKERDRFFLVPKKSDIEEKIISTKLAQTPGANLVMVKKERRLSLPALRPNSPRALERTYPRQTSTWTREDPTSDEKVIAKSVYTQTSELLSKYATSKKKVPPFFVWKKLSQLGL